MSIVRTHLVMVEQHAQNQRWHCVLSWDSTTPFYTELMFPDSVRWRFARQVWADGLGAPTWGAGGDVLVEPLSDGDLRVCLRGKPVYEGADGEIDLLTSQRLVSKFLCRTIGYVRLGEEPLPSGDELLAALLGG